MINKVRTTFDESVSGLRKLANSSVRDKLAAFRQQIIYRADKETSATKLDFEHLESENNRLNESSILREVQNSASPELIAPIKTLQGKITSLKLKFHTVPST